VHLSIFISEINQLDTQNFCFTISLFHASTCFEHMCSKHVEAAYFKHGIYSPFFPLQNAVCFIIITYLVPVLFTLYIPSVLKLKKIIPAPKG